jgi:hypothetical protein
MRRVLVDHARRKRADRRGGGARLISLEEVAVVVLNWTQELKQRVPTNER